MVEKNALLGYRAEHNAASLDGCPGLRSAMRERGERVGWEVVKARGRRIVGGQREAVGVGVGIGVLLTLVVGVLVRWGCVSVLYI